MDRAARTLLGQQALRPMVRFLEKNLESMLTPPANPSGFKFISPQSNAPDVGEEDEKTTETLVELEPIPDMPEEFFEALRLLNLSTPPSQPKSNNYALKKSTEAMALPLKKVPGDRFMAGEHVKIEPVSLASMGGAIQLQFHDLKLKNISLLTITRLGIAMKCDRCRTGTPLEDVRPDADRIYNCLKCKHKAQLHFRPDMVHEASRSAGFVRCKAATPLEFLPSNLQVTCGTCVPDDPLASTVSIQQVQVGECIAFDCRYCHSPCSLQLGRVDWVHLEGPVTGKTKRGPIPKLPSQVGEPLPDRGTCKHYRKSFRWFRFPCCGKAYPCDTCHDEDPSNAGHKAEWASRHICGLCSREFPVSQKECPCGAEPANTRHSAHWEGGKGMRDQTRMSRKDSKKYRNLTKPKPASK